MSALDQAFIKAYAKEPSPTKATASGGDAQAGGAQTKRYAAVVTDSPANTRIENIYSAGTLYRIETPRAAEPETVPPPHFANRGSRRLPLRYRLAQMDIEEAAPPAKRTIPPAVLHTPPQPTRRSKSQIPPPPPLPPAPSVEIEEPRAVVVITPWNEIFGSSTAVADATLVVWPPHQDLVSAHASSLITLDLETLPLPPLPQEEAGDLPAVDLPETVTSGIAESSAVGQTKKTYRIDAAHEPVVPPHQPPPTVEDLIKPAEPREKIQDRPPVVSDEEAAELVGVTLPQTPAAVVAIETIPDPVVSRHLVPAWEVDRFLWPALCEKLLKDDHSYFAQAGGKIVSAVRDGLKSLAITGSRRGEGRTTLALCLARSAAQAGLKVALVDADFSRPQLASSLGLEVTASWHEAALGKSPLSEAAVQSREDNITVLPLDASTAAAALSLSDPRLTKALRDAARAFDLLVLDLGPTAAGDESLFPDNEPPPADAAIVVRDLRYSTPSESQAIGERLSLSGIEAVGIAENFVPQEKLVA